MAKSKKNKTLKFIKKIAKSKWFKFLINVVLFIIKHGSELFGLFKFLEDYR